MELIDVKVRTDSRVKIKSTCTYIHTLKKLRGQFVQGTSSLLVLFSPSAGAFTLGRHAKSGGG